MLFEDKLKSKLLVLAVVLPTLLLPGCETLTTMKSSSSGNVDARLEHGDTAKFFSKSGLTACLGAGAATGLICLATNSKPVNCVIAAVAACGIGAGANYYLDVQRSKASNKEQTMDLILADIKKDTTKLKQLNQVAQTVLNEDKVNLRKAEQQLRAGKISKAQAQNQLNDASANLATLQKKLTNVKQRYAEYKQVVATEGATGSARKLTEIQLAGLNQQAQILEKSIAESGNLISKHRAIFDQARA